MSQINLIAVFQALTRPGKRRSPDWKQAIIVQLFQALDPLDDGLIRSHGASSLMRLAVLLVRIWGGGNLARGEIEEIVSDWRAAYDPLKKNIHPNTLSDALLRGIERSQFEFGNLPSQEHELPEMETWVVVHQDTK